MNIKDVRKWVAYQLGYNLDDNCPTLATDGGRWAFDGVTDGEKECVLLMGHYPNLITDDATEYRTFLVEVTELPRDQKVRKRIIDKYRIRKFDDEAESQDDVIDAINRSVFPDKEKG